MKSITALLIRTEIKSLFNQFRSTISNPSMLTFYGTSLVGAYFVSNLISTLIGFAPMFTGIAEIFQTNIDISILYSGFTIISFIAVLGGYLGIGAASVLVQTDEHVIMPAPILPYQVYVTRYVRRLIRRLVYATIAIFILLPVMSSGNILIGDILLSIVSILLFFEANYFLGGITAHFKKRFASRPHFIMRYLPIIVFTIIIFLPLLDGFRNNPIILYFNPAITTVSPETAILTASNIASLRS